MLWLSRYLLAGSFCLALGFQASTQSGQKPPTKAQQGDRQQLPRGISSTTYTANVDLVNVFVSAWNKNTKSFVTNLNRDDFFLYEDGKRQEISFFNRESNMPLTIALLVDTSQSVAPKLKFEQNAAIDFFYTVLRPTDQAMIVEFDSAVSLVQDLTNDANKLARQIRTMQAAGNTALYDSIVRTCDEKLIRETGRKTIVILSDGEDSASLENLDRAREMAMTADATVFSISINRGGFFGVGGDTRNGDRVLTQLANETGGKAFFPFRVEELSSDFQDISKELRSQYNIGYVSSNTLKDGSYRKIEVRVADKNLKLNFRKGYFAPKGSQ